VDVSLFLDDVADRDGFVAVGAESAEVEAVAVERRRDPRLRARADRSGNHRRDDRPADPDQHGQRHHHTLAKTSIASNGTS
jgi:hypothetical protein